MADHGTGVSTRQVTAGLQAVGWTETMTGGSVHRAIQGLMQGEGHPLGLHNTLRSPTWSAMANPLARHGHSAHTLAQVTCPITKCPFTLLLLRMHPSPEAAQHLSCGLRA